MPSRFALLLAALVGWAQPASALADSGPAEPRVVYTADSPAWLQAVGKLTVPGSRSVDGYRRHRREDCSGTLVAPSPASQFADVVITAWHCLEFYEDLSRPILFTLRPGSEQAITREAYRLSDGGGMDADWALLKLFVPVPRTEVAALTLHPGRADALTPVTMAGYSRDAGLGAGGAVLTYDPACRITRQDSGESESDCSAYKGASGGAVIQRGEDGAVHYSGVISRGDSQAISIYVPVAGFRRPLNRALD